MKNELKRVIFSPLFLLAVVLYAAAVFAQGIVNEGDLHTQQAVGPLALFIIGTQLGPSFHISYLVFSLACALPVAGLLLEDINSGFYKQAMARTTPLRYHASKLMAALVGCLLFAVLSNALALLALWIYHPIPTQFVREIDTYYNQPGFYFVVLNHSYWLLILISVAQAALFAVVYGLFALAVSPLLRNRFLAYASAFLFCQLITVASFILKYSFPSPYHLLSCTNTNYYPMEIIPINLIVLAGSLVLYISLAIFRRERYV